MRACPRCSVPMEEHSRAFAQIDCCPRCQCAFLDPGEGVAVLGAGAEPSFLLEDGRARRKGDSPLQCPAHGVVGEADDPMVRLPVAAPRMAVYVVGEGEDAIEIDYCGECGGFYLDAGEGAALLELAAEAERIIASRSGATFTAPPDDRQREAVDALRERKGRGLFPEMIKGLLHGRRGWRRELRYGRHGRPDVPRLFDDWRPAR